MDREHPYVVIGDGDVGAAAAYRLARAVGGGVLVLDAAPGPTAAAPSGPLVRADLAHPDDARTALAPAAYDAWRDLERLSGQTLLTTTPGVVVAGRDRPEVGRHTAVADRHGLDFAVLDALDIVRRWPQFRPGPDDHAFVHARSGLLDTARAAAVHRLLAADHGAEFRHGTPVRALRPAAGHVEVVLDGEVARAEGVVVAAGAGVEELLAGLRALPLVERARQTGRHTPSRLLDFCPARFPVFTWHSDDDAGSVVGVGALGGVVTHLTQDAPSPTPGARRAFLDRHVPGFAGPGSEDATHSRTLAVPADGAMVLGAPAEAPRIAVAAGTGREPMFAGVGGRALADLLLTGRTRTPIAPFGLDRRALDTAGRSR